MAFYLPWARGNPFCWALKNFKPHFLSTGVSQGSVLGLLLLWSLILFSMLMIPSYVLPARRPYYVSTNLCLHHWYIKTFSSVSIRLNSRWFPQSKNELMNSVWSAESISLLKKILEDLPLLRKPTLYDLSLCFVALSLNDFSLIYYGSDCPSFVCHFTQKLQKKCVQTVLAN